MARPLPPLDASVLDRCVTIIDAEGFSLAATQAITTAADEALNHGPCAIVADSVALAHRLVALMQQFNRIAASEQQTNEPIKKESHDVEAERPAMQCYRLGCRDMNARLRCSRCKQVHYCSPACQKMHWKTGGHKTLCKWWTGALLSDLSRTLHAACSWMLYFSRDQSMIQAIGRTDVAEVLLLLATNNTKPLQGQSDLSHCAPAGKALSNLMLGSAQLRVPFAKMGAVHRIFTCLRQLGDASNGTEEQEWVLIRLLFLLFATTPESLPDNNDENQSAIRILVNAVTARLPEIIEDTGSSNPSCVDIATESFKVMFVLMKNWFGEGQPSSSEVTQDRDHRETAVLQFKSKVEAFNLVAGVARSTVVGVPNKHSDLVSAAVEVFVVTPKGGFGSTLATDVNVSYVTQLAMKKKKVPLKAQTITERHWDPERPGEETVKRWERPSEEEVQNDAVEDDVIDVPEMPSLEGTHRLVLTRMILLLEMFLREHKDEDELSAVVSPILLLLRSVADENKTVRRFLKQQIVPRERDVSVAPNVGDSLRARLTKFFTSHNAHLKHAVAELFFVLCNRNVNRLVRRVGYGNAAGYLTTIGITAMEQINTSNYGDSDTDSEVDEEVNPVTGKLWDDDDNSAADRRGGTPISEMTDEQKEVAAHELLVMFDKLNKLGVIKAQLPELPRD